MGGSGVGRRVRGARLIGGVLAWLATLVCAAQAQDGSGFDLGTLLAGVDLTMMAAIGVVAIVCKRWAFVPVKVEMLIPLALGAIWGALQAWGAGAEGLPQVFAGIYKGAAVNGAAAIVAVYVVDPLLSAKFPGFGGTRPPTA